MSTADLYMNNDDITEFIHETKRCERTGGLFCIEEDDGPDYGVCPFITFYILYDPQGIKLDDEGCYVSDASFVRLGNHMIDIYETLLSIVGRPFQKIFKVSTETWFKIGDKRMPPLREERGV